MAQCILEVTLSGGPQGSAEFFGQQRKVYLGPFGNEDQARRYVESGAVDHHMKAVALEWRFLPLVNPWMIA